MKCSKLLLAVLCGIFLTGCGAAAEIPDVITDTISRSEFPAFGGCQELHLAGTLAASAASGTSYEGASSLIQFSNTNKQAWEKLLAGDLDIILAYAPPEEIDGETVLMQPIGTDPLTFLAGGTQEPVSLTKSEIIAAYQHEGTWQGYASAPDSASRLAAENLLGIGGYTITEDDETLTAACPYTAGTICYTTYLSVREDGKPENTAFAAVDGILPMEEAYPYQIQYFAACRAGLEQNDSAMVLYRWLTSEEGIQWLHETTVSDLPEPEFSSPDAS